MPRPQLVRKLGFLVPETRPQRTYGLAALVNAVGFGMVFTSFTLYLTRVVHLGTGQVGVGLTIAGVVGLLAGIPAGDLADRHGPREMAVATMFLQSLAAASYLFIHTFLTFTLLASVEMLVINAWLATDGPLTRRVGGKDGVAFRSAKQAVWNLGMSIGALSSGAAIEAGSADAYRVLIVGNAITFLAAAVILRSLPHYEALPRPQPEAGAEPRWIALRDKPFIACMAIVGAMSIQDSVIALSLPLWVVDHTTAPRWSVSLFLLINTVLVVLCQVRVGRNVATVAQGGAAARKAGVIFLVSCSGIGLAAGLPGWAALLLLIGAVALHTFGEMWFSSASFVLDFGLAPAHAQGQYEGVFGIGIGAGLAAAPILLVGVCLSLGRAGWLGLGAYFVVAGMAGPPLARWGQRTRPAGVEPGLVEPAVTSE
jgi:MFS family permease